LSLRGAVVLDDIHRCTHAETLHDILRCRPGNILTIPDWMADAPAHRCARNSNHLDNRPAPAEFRPFQPSAARLVYSLHHTLDGTLPGYFSFPSRTYFESGGWEGGCA